MRPPNQSPTQAMIMMDMITLDMITMTLRKQAEQWQWPR